MRSRTFGGIRIGCVIVAAVVAVACGPQSAASPGSTPTATPNQTSSPTPIPLPTFAQLSAPSRNVIWTLVAGSRLFRSTNRGDSWEERPLPTRSPSGPSLVNAEMSFVNEREGWLSSVGPPATQCTFQGIAIWHTADGGSTWEQLTTTGIADGQCKRDLSFADALHGFVGASDRSNAPVIYRTSDGGRSWSTSRPLPDPPGFTTQPGGFSLQAQGVHAFGPTLLLAATGQSNGRSLTYVFRSQDGGASWSYVTTLGELGIPVAFVTASRWVQIKAGGESLETTDAGATWHRYATNYTQAAGVAPSIVFGDADVGYATVRGGIQRSLDGGAHWSFIKTPGTG